MLKSSDEGLSQVESERRLNKVGLNQITPRKQTHWFVKFLISLVGGFQLMLFFGAILCFIVFGISNGTDVQTLVLAIVLVLLVFITSIFQIY